jgi:hypothetical protein
MTVMIVCVLCKFLLVFFILSRVVKTHTCLHSLIFMSMRELRCLRNVYPVNYGGKPQVHTFLPRSYILPLM